jgi:acyl-CoA synthetase (NDP forming)
MNYAGRFGIGISRAVSVGNSAMVAVPDFVEYFAADPETAVAIVYLEGVPDGDGRSMIERLMAVSDQLPIVLVKGGRTRAGARAAASHSGALASDDRVLTGACRQAGIMRVATVEAAYETAAALASQPLPAGPRLAVLTTAGGWGVLATDAITATPGLELVPLPDDLRSDLDAVLPPRWSRSNPVDLVGGETKDTIPTVLGLLARHPDIDAVVVLAIGIQANQARLEAAGPFHPDHGLDRIVGFHTRQEVRYQETVAALLAETGKPILVATELAVCDPENPAVTTAIRLGHGCYASPERAITALARMRWYAEWRRRRARVSP